MAFKPSTIDYGRIEAEREARMDPRELEDHRHVKRTLEIRERSHGAIPATFTSFSWNPTTKENEPGQSWERPVQPRVEYRDDRREGPMRVVHFDNAETGHEAYRVDANFQERVAAEGGDPSKTWAICAGSANHARCEVAVADVAAFLDLEERNRERLVGAMKAVHEPPVHEVRGGHVRRNELLGNMAGIDFEVSVERHVPMAHGVVDAVLTIRALEAVERRPLDRELRAHVAEAARDDLPFVTGGNGQGESDTGMGVPAKAVEEAIRASDHAYSRDVLDHLADNARDHSIATREGGRIAVAVLGDPEGPERRLRVVGDGFKAMMVLDPARVEGLSAKGWDGTVEAASRDAEGRVTASHQIQAGHLLSVLAVEKAAPQAWLSRRHGIEASPHLDGRDGPDLGPLLGEFPATPAGTDPIDALPGATTNAAGERRVPVHVKRTDLDALLGRGDAKGGLVGDVAYGQALNFFSDAIRQPTFVNYRPTGEERKGISGMTSLTAGFGGGGHRRLWLDPQAMREAIAEPNRIRGFRKFGPGDGEAFLATLVEGTGTRASEVAAEKAAKEAAKGRIRTEGRRAGAER